MDNKYIPWIVGGIVILLLLASSKGSRVSQPRVASLGPLPRDNADTSIYAQERTERANLVASTFNTLSSFALGARTVDSQETIALRSLQTQVDLSKIDATSRENLSRIQLEGLRRTLAHGSRDQKRKLTQEITLADITAQTQRNAVEQANRTDRNKNLLNAITSGLSDILGFFSGIF